MSSAPSPVHPAVLELFCGCSEERRTQNHARQKIQCQTLNWSCLFLSLLFAQGFCLGSLTSVTFRTEQDIHRALLSPFEWEPLVLLSAHYRLVIPEENVVLSTNFELKKLPLPMVEGWNWMGFKLFQPEPSWGFYKVVGNGVCQA